LSISWSHYPPFIDQQRLNTLNPPENLRIAIEKFGWKKKTITA
ncbi:hypothetical protein, partial [Escherichia coli]